MTWFRTHAVSGKERLKFGSVSRWTRNALRGWVEMSRWLVFQAPSEQG